MKLTKTEKRVLELLMYGMRQESNVFTFGGVAKHLGITRIAAKRACRKLAREGFAEHSPFWTDGGLGGSGYCITGKGIALVTTAEKKELEHA